MCLCRSVNTLHQTTTAPQAPSVALAHTRRDAEMVEQQKHQEPAGAKNDSTSATEVRDTPTPKEAPGTPSDRSSTDVESPTPCLRQRATGGSTDMDSKEEYLRQGHLLFPMVRRLVGRHRAAKVTGMILELDPLEISALIADGPGGLELRSLVDEALALLLAEEQNASVTTAGASDDHGQEQYDSAHVQ